MDNELISCLQSQVDEVEMLFSIFYNPGEIVVPDQSIIADFNDFISGISTTKPIKRLEYFIKLIIDSESYEIKIELPHYYPLVNNPVVTIRSNALNATKERDLRESTIEFINGMDRSDVYVYQMITWIQEQIESLVSSEKVKPIVPKSNSSSVDNKINLERLWIYSHHLKSKIKRQDLISNARDLNLSGFSRPGKPGIICVEGLQENTQQFWRIVKSWQWQKITIKFSEIETGDFNTLSSFKKFEKFSEELFTNGEEDNAIVPMNMSLFMKFLDSHNCSYAKKELFGFE